MDLRWGGVRDRILFYFMQLNRCVLLILFLNWDGLQLYTPTKFCVIQIKGDGILLSNWFSQCLLLWYWRKTGRTCCSNFALVGMSYRGMTPAQINTRMIMTNRVSRRLYLVANIIIILTFTFTCTSSFFRTITSHSTDHDDAAVEIMTKRIVCQSDHYRS